MRVGVELRVDIRGVDAEGHALALLVEQDRCLGLGDGAELFRLPFVVDEDVAVWQRVGEAAAVCAEVVRRVGLGDAGGGVDGRWGDRAAYGSLWAGSLLNERKKANSALPRLISLVRQNSRPLVDYADA